MCDACIETVHFYLVQGNQAAENVKFCKMSHLYIDCESCVFKPGLIVAF